MISTQRAASLLAEEEDDDNTSAQEKEVSDEPESMDHSVEGSSAENSPVKPNGINHS